VLAVKKGTPETEIVSGAASQHASRNRVKLPPMRQERIYLAIHRFNDSVYYRRIERESFALLSALRVGASVAEAVTSAFETSKLTPEGQADLLHKTFAHASELGWFCRQLDDDDSAALLLM
jgi:hypothetical protein